MSRPRIAIDIDEVLAHTTDSVRLFVNQKYGVGLTPEHYLIPGEYVGYYQHVWQTNGLPYETIHSEYVTAMLTNDVPTIQAVPGAAAGVELLAQSFDLYPVSSRWVNLQDITTQWLADTIPALQNAPILLGSTTKNDLHKTKGQICRENGYSYLIEDNPQYCQDAIDQGVTAILFGEYGWQETIPPGAVRCKTWSDVIDYFKAVAA